MAVFTSDQVYPKTEVDQMIQKTKESLIEEMKKIIIVAPSQSSVYVINPGTMFMSVREVTPDE